MSDYDEDADAISVLRLIWMFFSGAMDETNKASKFIPGRLLWRALDTALYFVSNCPHFIAALGTGSTYRHEAFKLGLRSEPRIVWASTVLRVIRAVVVLLLLREHASLGLRHEVGMNVVIVDGSIRVVTASVEVNVDIGIAAPVDRPEFVGERNVLELHSTIGRWVADIRRVRDLVCFAAPVVSPDPGNELGAWRVRRDSAYEG